MGKALGSWNGMRKYLEKEMLCNALQGRIRYSCTTFAGMDGCGVFEVFVDNKLAKRFSMETVASNLYTGAKPVDMQEYWKNYWYEKEHTPIEKRKEFDDTEFSEALEKYRSISISEALHSTNPIIRMFAILDRRVGKRTLKKFNEIVETQPKWLQFFYELRLYSEKITE